MVFFELRWNYSPLKEKAVLLPDGLSFVFVAKLCFAPLPLKSIYPPESISTPDASRLPQLRQAFNASENLKRCGAKRQN
jgi:hypothetical protein